jgi:hypothetical protein
VLGASGAAGEHRQQGPPGHDVARVGDQRLEDGRRRGGELDVDAVEEDVVTVQE